jgi:hypothetical protein
VNPATITALITAATALIGAISGLVILIVHIINHQPIPGDNPPAKPAENGQIKPAIGDKAA